MSLKEVFASLEDPGKRISWQNDLVQGLIIDRFFNKLTPIFEAKILTPGHTPSSTRGTAPNPKNLWCRLRPIQTTDVMLPNPWKVKGWDRKRKVINQHPLGWLKETEATSAAKTSRPQVGEIWQCRYTTKNKMGIELIKKVRGTHTPFKEDPAYARGAPTPLEELSWEGIDMEEVKEEYLKNPSIPYSYGGKGKADSEVKYWIYKGEHT